MSGPGQRAGGRRLERTGQVVLCEGDAVVRFPPPCGLAAVGCAVGCAGGCMMHSTSAGGRVAPARWPQMPVTVLQGGAALEPGDQVVVSLSAAALTGLAWLLFGLPLAALLAGAWIGGQLAGLIGASEDLGAALTGLSCLLLTTALLAAARRGQAGEWQAMLGLSVRRDGTDS